LEVDAIAWVEDGDPVGRNLIVNVFIGVGALYPQVRELSAASNGSHKVVIAVLGYINEDLYSVWVGWLVGWVSSAQHQDDEDDDDDDDDDMNIKKDDMKMLFKLQLELL